MKEQEKIKITPEKKDIEKINEKYKKMIKNPDFLLWRQNHIKNLSYYLGETEIEPKTLNSLLKRGIRPVGCNIIAPVVHTLLGIEMQTTYDINVQINDVTEEARDCEMGLNQYFYELQNKEETAQNMRMALKDGLIGGLGFCRVYYDRNEPKVSYLSPLNIILDFNDTTSFFSQQDCIFTWEDLPEKAMHLLLGSAEFKRLKFDKDPEKDYYASLNRLSQDLCYDTEFAHRVYTMHEIEIKDGYKGFVDGNLFYTLDEKIGEKLEQAELCPLSINTMTTICQGKILKTYVQEPTVINGRIPIAIFCTNKVAGALPKSLVDSVTTVQSGFNTALSKSIAYSNTEKTIIQLANVGDRERYEQQPDILTKPNTVIFLSPEDKFNVVKPNDIINQQAGFMNLFNDYLKKVTGLEDESKGIPTNAISGVALQQRDINSLRSTAYIFNNYKIFKKQIGTFVLQQLQNSYKTDIIVNLQENSIKKQIILNQVVEDEETGEVKINNNIVCMKWNIIIKQTVAEQNLKEKEKESLLELFSSPIASLVLQSERLLGLFVANPKEIKAEISKIQTEQNEAQQQAEQQQNYNNNAMLQ